MEFTILSGTATIGAAQILWLTFLGCCHILTCRALDLSFETLELPQDSLEKWPSVNSQILPHSEEVSKFCTQEGHFTGE